MRSRSRPKNRGPRETDNSISEGGDSYKRGEARREQNGNRTANQSDFTFTTAIQAPQFPPTGPAAHERGPPKRRGRGGAAAQNGDRDGRQYMRTGPGANGGRNPANSFRRGGFRRLAPHERALLQTRDDSIEHVLGVSIGSNKFRNLEDLSNDEEAAMDTDTDSSDAAAGGQHNKHKVARMQSAARADGDSVPRWSNPDPYTVLPPPEEVTGKRLDVVELIRKSRREATAVKAQGTNAVAANDDFISFGDVKEDGPPSRETDQADKQSSNKLDKEDNQSSKEDDGMPPLAPWAQQSLDDTPVVGSLNDVVASGALSAPTKRSVEAAGLPERPAPRNNTHKRKRGELRVGIVEGWLPSSNQHPTPWANDQRNEHLRRDPLKW